MFLRDLAVGASTTIDPDCVMKGQDGSHWVNGTQMGGQGGFRVIRTLEGLRAAQPLSDRRVTQTWQSPPGRRQGFLPLTLA